MDKPSSKTPYAKGPSYHNYNNGTLSDKLPFSDNEKCSGCRKLFKFPQIILLLLSFEISKGIMRNQKVIIA